MSCNFLPEPHYPIPPGLSWGKEEGVGEGELSYLRLGWARKVCVSQRGVSLAQKEQLVNERELATGEVRRARRNRIAD